MRFEERVIACFKGLAAGDAVGKQTETLTRAEVLKWYPGGISGFHGRPGDVIPRYRGRRYEWRIGETTDDTEQTIAVARALLREGEARHEAIGKELLRCVKSVHPGVSMWAFSQAGNPARIASDGDGCGAAMRSAPVGVMYPPSRLDELVRGAYECAIPTHGGQLGVCAAAAVACAVSAALEGQPPAEVLRAAVQGCERAKVPRSCRLESGSRLSSYIDGIHADLSARPRLVVEEVAQQYFPNRTEIIVALAIGLALVTQSAEQTALFAANLGGDADTVASIGGAVAGALRPQTVNERWFEVVNWVNRDHVLEIAASLAAARRS